MDNGTVEAEPADIAADDVASAAVEDPPASDAKLEAVESVEDDVSEQLPPPEAVSGPLERSPEHELTICTDDEDEQVQPDQAGQNLIDSASLDPDLTIDRLPSVGSLDDSETSAMEMGSSVAEDVISAEEADATLLKGSEETPGIDGKDSDNIQGSEKLKNAVGETAGCDVADEGLDSGETCATVSESILDPENTEDSENSAKEGEKSPTQSDDTAKNEKAEKSLQDVEADLLASSGPDDTRPEGTVEGPRDDSLAENSADVISDVPTTIMTTADVVEESDVVQEPESEPLVSEAPDSDQSASVESANDVETDQVDEVSEKEQGVVERKETHTSEGGLSNSLLEAAEQLDNDTSEAEAVKISSISADFGTSEVDSIVLSESSPTISVEDDELSTTGEEQVTSNGSSPQSDPTSSPSREDKEDETHVPTEGEEERSLDIHGNERVHYAEIDKSAETGTVNEDDQGAKTDGDVVSPSPVAIDGTDMSSSNSAVAEILETGDGLVEDVDKSPQLPVEAEEIAEVATNEHDAPPSGVETAEEAQVVGSESETESPSPTVPEWTLIASPDTSEDSSTGDAVEQVEDTNAPQPLSPDTDEVVEVLKEPDERSSSMEQVGNEQVVELERKVEVPSASDTAEANPLDLADIPEAVEEDEATDGREFIGSSTSPCLDTEEKVEVTSRGQDAPTSSSEEGGEEQGLGADSEVETPGHVDPGATEVKSVSTEAVTENIDSGEATDILENGDALLVASDADKNVEGVAVEHDTPTASTDSEEEKEVETGRELEPLGQTDAKSIGAVSSADVVTKGGVTGVAENMDVPSVASPGETEFEFKTELDSPASLSELEAEVQIAAIDPETSVETHTVPNAMKMNLLTSAESPESSEVPETGNPTRLVKNDGVSIDFTTNGDRGSEVGGNGEDNPVSDSDAVEAEQVMKIDGEVHAHGVTVPDATGTGLLTSATIHLGNIETDDASNHEEKADSAYPTLDEGSSNEAVDKQDAFISPEEVKDGDNTLTWISPGTHEIDMGQDEQVTDLVQIVGTPDQMVETLSVQDISKVEPTVASVPSEEPEEENKVLPCEDADVRDVEVSEREISVGDTPQISSSSSNLIETNETEKPQDQELQVEVPAATLNDNQISVLVQGEQVPEASSKVEASGEVIEDEGIVAESEGSGPGEVADISSVDGPEQAAVAVPAFINADVITSSSLAAGAESAEAQNGEELLSGPAGENTALSTASEKVKLMPPLLTEPAVSTLDESGEDRGIGGTEARVKGLANAALDVPELILYVTEDIGSPGVEGDTLTEVKVPEHSTSLGNTFQSDAPSPSEEKVIFTTDFKQVSQNARDQEDLGDENDLLPFSLPIPSSNLEESLEAKGSTCKLANDGSTHAVLHISGPSSYHLTVFGDRDVEQKEISGYDNVSVKNIVTPDRSVEGVRTVSGNMPITSEVEDPLGSNDVKLQSLQAVTSPDIQEKEILSINEANVAAKMRGDFLMDEENHPLRGQHFAKASKGPTLACSGNEEDSSRRWISASDIPTLSQGGASARADSPLQLGALNVQKDEASVPLSTYTGDLSSSWVAVRLAGASEVRHRPSVSEENIIETQMPRLRAVASGGEERRSVTERDVLAASIAPVKSTDSVPKSRAQMIRGDEDFNDAKFPLSVMLWCSQSLSSLFGSAKSL